MLLRRLDHLRIIQALLTFLLFLLVGCPKPEDEKSELVGTWYLAEETRAYVVTTNEIQVFASTVNESDGVSLTGDVTSELLYWTLDRNENGDYNIYGAGASSQYETELNVSISSNDTSAIIFKKNLTDDVSVTFICPNPNVAWDPSTLDYSIENSVFVTSDGRLSLTANGSFKGSYIDVPANIPTKLVVWKWKRFPALHLTINENGTYTMNEWNGSWSEDGDSIAFDGEGWWAFNLEGANLTLSNLSPLCESEADCSLESEELGIGFDTGSLTEIQSSLEWIFNKHNPTE